MLKRESVVSAGRSSAGAGPGHGLQPAVWCGAAVLRRQWPPTPCWGTVPCELCLVAGGDCLVLLRDSDTYRAVSGGLQSGAALISVRLDVRPLLPRSPSPTVVGCLLGGFPVGRDWWGGERVVGGVLPRINIVTDV